MLVVEQVFTDVNSSIKIIHGGMTPLLQFLDMHVNKPFKDIMKEKWEDQIINGEAEFTEMKNRIRASYQLVAEWAHDAQKKVATDELIKKGFRQCGYIEYDSKTSNAFKITRNNQETRGSRGGNSRSKRISERDDGFVT